MIAWGDSQSYDTGSSNAVALDNHGNVVEVHVGSGNLYCRIGKVDFVDRTIAWWDSQPSYDTGNSNAVALDNNGNVVEVHVGSGNLYYRIGKVDFVNGTITWGDNENSRRPYDTGSSNAVALDNNGNVVEVHVGSGNLYCRVGKVDFANGTITWWDNENSRKPYDTGTANAVALDNNGNIVGVHVGSGNLYCRVGKVDFVNGTIAWGGSTQYDTGDSNAVALDNNGNVVEVHVGTAAQPHTLMYRIGKVDFGDHTIDWEPSTQYDTGDSGGVALYESGTSVYAVEVHIGTAAEPHQLMCRVGELAAKSFFICAHQDDWFLFRGEVAYSDLKSMLAVLVLTTSGDGACTDGWWEVREQAALAAMRGVGPKAPMLIDIVTVIGANGRTHPIVRYRIGTAGSGMYCLRLPCGKNDPNNLTNLMNGVITRLEAVDHSTIYTSWDDLCTTLKNIVLNEKIELHPWVNAPYYISDNNTNKDDHPDHHATGLAVKTFASGFCSRAWWWSYAIAERQDWKLNDLDYSKKQRLYETYYDTVEKLVATNGSPSCSVGSAGSLPGDWDKFGEYSHSLLAIYPEPDPA